MKLAIAGLGHIAKYHLAAIDHCPDIDVVAGFDTNRERLDLLPRSVRQESSLDDLVEGNDIDAVLIATPTPTHEEVALRVLEARKPVLIEKPATLSLYAFERLRGAACSAGVPVFTLFHASYGSEVRAAKEAIDSSSCPLILSWHSAFHDPYAGDRGVQSSLINSWVDSGINALSVVQTVLGGVRLANVFSTHTPPDGPWATDNAIQTFEVGGAWSGLVTIECSWRSGVNHKSSRVVIGSGEKLILDHTGEAFMKTARDGKVEMTADYKNERERLTNHYIRAFRDAARVLSQGLSNWEFSEACHYPYFEAFRKTK